jgi:hypothetical protein
MESKRVRNVGVGGLAIAALAATAFAVGSMVDDGDGDGRRTFAAGELLPRVHGPGALDPVRSCEGLVDYYVDHTIDQIGPWGWGYQGYPDVWFSAARDGVVLVDEGLGSGAMVDARVPAPVNRALTKLDNYSSATGTNVQEIGVDEPDVVKTNGELLVRVEDDDVVIYDVSGDEVERLDSYDLPGDSETDAELLLVGDRALVITRERGYDRFTPVSFGAGNPSVRLTTLDLSEPDDPQVRSTQEYGGDVISARQYGTAVRLVLGTGLPDLEFVEPGDDRTQREATRENREILRESTADDWLPTVSDDGGDPELAVECDAMNTPEEFAGAGSVVVVGYDAATPEERDATGVATTSTTVYSSTDRLYLATSSAWWGGPGCCWDGGRVAAVDDGVTSLHAFELSGTSATYVASGEVEGYLRDRWAMDAVDGVLRVAVGPSTETGNFNSVLTLRQEGDELVEAGRVDRLGVDEEIKAVRWFDDLAIVVTFRQIDPLYAIDLSDPENPKALGELKIPGFSEYLHPIGDDLMLGIGQDATRRGMTRGGQAAVFDLSDPAHPKRLSHLSYGDSKQTLAGQDPRQFTWLPESRTALTVVASWGKAGGYSGWVSALEVGGNGQLDNRMIEGTHGYDDVNRLRTVPLPDGRVVLVTESSARFLDL